MSLSRTIDVTVSAATLATLMTALMATANSLGEERRALTAAGRIEQKFPGTEVYPSLAPNSQGAVTEILAMTTPDKALAHAATGYEGVMARKEGEKVKIVARGEGVESVLALTQLTPVQLHGAASAQLSAGKAPETAPQTGPEGHSR